MLSTTFRRAFAPAVFIVLCRCSLLFDLNDLRHYEGIDAGGPDAETVGSGDAQDSEPAAIDATTDAGESGAGGGLDGGLESGLDGGVDSSTDARAFDVGTDVARTPDATKDGTADASPDSGDGSISDGTAEGSAGCGVDGGTLATGLVAFYRFDETSGTTAFDASGNNSNATMQGATFARGLKGNAATMNGTAQYVSLPTGIVSGLASFSFSAWVYLNGTGSHSRIFDFGTGTTAYMFLWPGTGTSRFAISVSGGNAEQRTDAPVWPMGSWQHAVVTLTRGTARLYVNGTEAGQNATITLTPASLGVADHNWLGRSEFSIDPYLIGQMDNVRIYDRALSPCEVIELFQQQL